jgi:hypothetical protein
LGVQNEQMFSGLSLKADEISCGLGLHVRGVDVVVQVIEATGRPGRGGG